MATRTPLVIDGNGHPAERPSGDFLSLLPGDFATQSGGAFLAAAAGSGTPTFRAINIQDINLVTKGDLLTTDGTSISRLIVGADGRVLMADSGSGEGLSWEIPLPVTITSSTTSSTVGNTTTQTILATSTVSFAANTLAIGQIYRVKWWGDFVRTGTPSITFAPFLGSSLDTFNSVGFAADGQWNVEYDIAVRSIGTSGFLCSNAFMQASVGGGSPKGDIIGGVKVIDTTAAIELGLKITWSAANASDVVTMRAMRLERVA